MDTSEVIKLTKQEVTKRHIESAIQIFFTFNEPVALHVVISSAERILSDLCEKGNISIIDDLWIKSEHKGKWRKAKRDAFNYMHHADNDHDSTKEFHPKLNDMLIHCCMLRYKKLWNQETDLMRLFFMYFLIVHNNLFSSEIQTIANQFPEIHQKQDIRSIMWEEKDTILKNCPNPFIPIM